jgi:hypothetical protein
MKKCQEKCCKIIALSYILVRGISRSDHLQSCYELKKALGDQVAILGDYNNHSKAVVIDETEAMVLTANLDAQHGLDSGVEIAFSSRNEAFVRAVSTFMGKLREGAELEFVINPTQSQAAERAWMRGKPVPWKDIHLQINKHKITPQILQKLVAALQTQLVKVANAGKDGKALIHLISKDLIAECTVTNAGQLTVLNVKNDPWSASRARFDCFLPKSMVTITTDLN